MRVTIANPEWNGPAASLTPGERLEFGRSVGGVGRLDGSEAISRLHGVVSVGPASFTVEATGTFSGVVVVDNTTPSRLYIPSGVGPVDVPFKDCYVMVDYGDGRSRLDVTVDGSPRADAWAEQWGADAPPRPRAGARRRGSPSALTRRVIEREKRIKRQNGSYYSWFTVLVALCEPLFDEEPGASPTNAQLARRTGFTQKDVEKKLSSVYRALDVEHEDRPRDGAARRAVTSGIVTREHLELLEPSTRRLR